MSFHLLPSTYDTGCYSLSTHVKWCDRKSRAACAQSFAPRQQATIEIMLAISICVG